MKIKSIEDSLNFPPEQHPKTGAGTINVRPAGQKPIAAPKPQNPQTPQSKPASQPEGNGAKESPNGK
jgi:hypothetical protein